MPKNNPRLCRIEGLRRSQAPGPLLSTTSCERRAICGVPIPTFLTSGELPSNNTIERYLLAALAFVATLDVVVLIVRVAGMFADSSVRENVPLVRAELVLLFLTVIGSLIEFFRRRRVIAAQLESRNRQ